MKEPRLIVRELSQNGVFDDSNLEISYTKAIEIRSSRDFFYVRQSQHYTQNSTGDAALSFYMSYKNLYEV